MKILTAGMLSIAMMTSAFAHGSATDQNLRIVERSVSQKNAALASRIRVAGEMVCDANNRSQCK